MKSSLPISRARSYFTWMQLIVVYGLTEGALWSRHVAMRNRWALAAAIAILIFVVIDVALSDQPALRRLGLGLPTTFGASLVLAI